jgi:hypoxanthine phosphoribosyltransferase
VSTPEILFSEGEISGRVNALALRIASAPQRPDLMAGILVGAFIFAADLARALTREGLALPVEFLWLRSYGDARTGGDVQTLVGPTDNARGRHVLLVDGVLDHGSTLAKARAMLLKAGAATVATAVVVDKLRDGAHVTADYAAFEGVSDFIVGYGMDDGGEGRALPYIGRVKVGD